MEPTASVAKASFDALYTSKRPVSYDQEWGRGKLGLRKPSLIVSPMLIIAQPTSISLPRASIPLHILGLTA